MARSGLSRPVTERAPTGIAARGRAGAYSSDLARPSHGAGPAPGLIFPLAPLNPAIPVASEAFMVPVSAGYRQGSSARDRRVPAEGLGPVPSQGVRNRGPPGDAMVTQLCDEK